MGKRKIEIERIEDEQKRQVTFSKRRKGIFSKATQLCDMDLSRQIAIVTFSPAGKPYTFSHSTSIDAAIHHCLPFTSTSNYYPTSQITSTHQHQKKQQQKGIREVLDQDTERLKSWDEAMSLGKRISELDGKVSKRIQQLSSSSSSPSPVVLGASTPPFITTGFSTACVSKDIHHEPSSSCSWEALISDELATLLQKIESPDSFTSMMLSAIFDGNDNNIANNDPQITSYTEDDQDPSRSIDRVAAPVANHIEDPTLATTSSNVAANNLAESATTLLATANNSQSHFTSTTFVEELATELLSSNNIGMEDDVYISMQDGELYWC